MEIMRETNVYLAFSSGRRGTAQAVDEVSFVALNYRLYLTKNHRLLIADGGFMIHTIF